MKKSVKSYNKWRHKYFLGYDSFCKKLYPGDYIEITIDDENVPTCSFIYFDFLNGALVQNTPATKWMFNKKIDDDSFTNLSQILHNDKNIIRKISYNDYLIWFNNTNERYKKYYNTIII